MARPASPARLGLGTAALSRIREVSEAVAVATIRRAVDLGVSLIDTAPHYGWGRAEELVGAALAGLDRSKITISTKIGRRLDQDGDRPVSVLDYGYDAAWRSLEDSLRRLGVDRVDVLHAHDPLDATAAREGEFRALQEMREQGLVARIGCGMNEVEPLIDYATDLELDCVMIAGELNLLDRSALEVLVPTCRERGIEIWAAGVFGTGILTDPAGGSYRYRPAMPQVRERVEALADVCRQYGATLPAAAIQFPRRQAGIAAVIVGAQRPEHVDQMVAGWSVALPDELWEELDRTAAGQPAVGTPAGAEQAK